MSRVPPLVVFAGCIVGCGSESAFDNQSQTDVFEQYPNDQVDILFVVDDSNSMTEEQQALADGFEAFVQSLYDVNTRFQLGVVSTSADNDDPAAGVLIGDPPFLTVSDDDYVAEFQRRVKVGVSGSDKEKGLQAAAWAVSKERLAGPNAGFVRDGANLLVAVVSDEEDCSDKGALDGWDASGCYSHPEFLPPVRDFVDDLVAAKGGNEELVKFGAIIGPTLDGGCDTAVPGLRYAQAMSMVGGAIGDICSADWSDMLYQLGLNATGIKREFPLSQPALPETIEVTVDDVAVLPDPLEGWTYDQDEFTVTFHGDAVPARGTQIVITYEVQPN